mmetsp:Transcript_64610/g.148563  ORF Transcript_64610/g.148563 Transcript_64610/m.148563 type:complete len:685 (+) Transcript_64610:2-2056(+)
MDFQCRYTKAQLRSFLQDHQAFHALADAVAERVHEEHDQDAAAQSLSYFFGIPLPVALELVVAVADRGDSFGSILRSAIQACLATKPVQNVGANVLTLSVELLGRSFEVLAIPGEVVGRLAERIATERGLDFCPILIDSVGIVPLDRTICSRLDSRLRCELPSAFEVDSADAVEEHCFARSLAVRLPAGLTVRPAAKCGNAALEVIGQGLRACSCLQSLTIQLRYGDLSIVGARALASGLVLCPLVHLVLDLPGNHLASVGSHDLAEGIANCKTLEVLIWELAENGVGDRGCRNLSAHIAGCPRLRSLTLGLGENQVSHRGARGLVDALREMPLDSLTLRLQCNPIGSQGASELGRLHRPRILQLGLESCEIGSGAVLGLAGGLSGSQVLTFLQLQLLDNEIDSAGFSAIWEPLRDSGVRGIDLTLSCNPVNNPVFEGRLPAFLNCLRLSLMQSGITCQINEILDMFAVVAYLHIDLGYNTLAFAPWRGSLALRELYLSLYDTGIGDAELAMLCEGIGGCLNLEGLELCCASGKGGNGLGVLGNKLPGLPQLQKLCIDCDSSGLDTGFDALVSDWPRCGVLSTVVVRCGGCRIRAGALADALGNSKIASLALALSDCGLTAQDCADLGWAIASASKLHKLDLEVQDLDEGWAMAIRSDVKCQSSVNVRVVQYAREPLLHLPMSW